jgi:hypothetical protein
LLLEARPINAARSMNPQPIAKVESLRHWGLTPERPITGV